MQTLSFFLSSTKDSRLHNRYQARRARASQTDPTVSHWSRDDATACPRGRPRQIVNLKPIPAARQLTMALGRWGAGTARLPDRQPVRLPVWPQTVQDSRPPSERFLLTLSTHYSYWPAGASWLYFHTSHISLSCPS